MISFDAREVTAALAALEAAMARYAAAEAAAAAAAEGEEEEGSKAEEEEAVRRLAVADAALGVCAAVRCGGAALPKDGRALAEAAGALGETIPRHFSGTFPRHFPEISQAAGTFGWEAAADGLAQHLFDAKLCDDALSSCDIV